MSLKLRKVLIFLFFSQLLSTSLTGCKPAEVKEGETTVQAAQSAGPAAPGGSGQQNAADPGTVCNPFGGGSAGRDQGLKGELFHLGADLPRYQNVSDYINHGDKLDATLFFDQVNVPTRPFDAGFVSTDGNVMKTPAGDTLYEWFGIRFESNIRLTNQDAVGKYQFALIADDGAVLLQKLPDGSYKTIVDNDGQHATKFRVAKEAVALNAHDQLPIEIRYYQGPRMHIAAMLLWREMPEGAAAKDPLDGKEGNDLFFASNVVPSKPLAAYQQLLSRGWRPVPAANFYLPSEAPANPCPETPAEPEVPSVPSEPSVPSVPAEPESPALPTAGNFAISGFDATTTASEANLIWRTSGVATSSKVYYGLGAGNLNQVIDLGSARSEVHQVKVSGLQSGQTYYFRAESKDANGVTQSSGVIQKMTK